MDRAQEATRLFAIRNRVALLDGARVMLASDGDGMMLDVAGADGSIVTIARMTGHASPEEIELLAHGLDDNRFLLHLLDRAIARLRPSPPPEPARRTWRDHTTEAAMLCDSRVFQRFLAELHGLEPPHDKDRAAQRLRSVLGITSRKAINEDDGARQRWIALRQDFYTWKGRALT